MSIRLRLTLWYSAVLLLGLALFGGGMWWTLEQRLSAGIDARLSQRAEGIRTVLEMESSGIDRKQLIEELTEFAQATPEGSLIQLRDRHGALLPPGPLPLILATDRPLRGTTNLNGHSYRILAIRIQCCGNQYDLLVATSLDELSLVLRDFRRLLWFMVPAVLAIACVGGYWISRRALAPVDDITRVAKSISVRNLSNRLAVPQTGDELQRMSETWNQVLERLDLAVKRIRQFTADASHELRTPLALIRTSAEVALRRERPALEYQAYLCEIQNEAERMTDLTESLLTLARSDSGGEMAMGETDANDIVRDVVRQNQPVAEANGVALKAEPTTRPALATANGPAIRRLLLTLIDNALKHTPRGGTVTVSVASGDDHVVLAVEDSGEGIEPEILPHIFERFFRADTARGSGSGVGLGLSIAQSIAQAHGSRIEVRSAPGAGSRFSVSLRSWGHAAVRAVVAV